VTVAPIQDNEPMYGEADDDVGVSLTLKGNPVESKRCYTSSDLCRDAKDVLLINYSPAGQMLHMEEWNMIIFLATPQMPDLESLLAAGLYINDLSLHDCSRYELS